MLLASATAASLVLTGCTSTSSAPRTVIVTNTVTGTAGSPTPSGSGGSATTGRTGSAVVVVPPSGSGKATPTGGPTRSTPKSTAPAKPTPTKSTAAPFQKVDPLTADCQMLLSQDDVKKALGATIPSGAIRVRDVADAGRGVTGKIRCRFGSTDGGKSGRVTVLLTKYGSADAAVKQVQLTRTTEQDLGAKSSATKVNGYPAQILLRDGGLVTMQYDNWTMSVVAAKGLAPDDRLTGGLPVLAAQVLTRILRNA